MFGPNQFVSICFFHENGLEIHPCQIEPLAEIKDKGFARVTNVSKPVLAHVQMLFWVIVLGCRFREATTMKGWPGAQLSAILALCYLEYVGQFDLAFSSRILRLLSMLVILSLQMNEGMLCPSKFMDYDQ